MNKLLIGIIVVLVVIVLVMGIILWRKGKGTKLTQRDYMRMSQDELRDATKFRDASNELPPDESIP